MNVRDVEFVSELPPSNGSGNWDALRRKETEEFAAALKEHPGEWAIYPWPQAYEAARTMASRIRRGLTGAFRRGFEAATRDEVLYVRYVGE